MRHGTHEATYVFGLYPLLLGEVLVGQAAMNGHFEAVGAVVALALRQAADSLGCVQAVVQQRGEQSAAHLLHIFGISSYRCYISHRRR